MEKHLIRRCATILQYPFLRKQRKLWRFHQRTLGLTETAPVALEDSRVGSNKQHDLLPLLRQSIYSRLAGYEDVNDAERLSVDPAIRHVVGGRAALADKRAASTSEVRPI